jgi:hypothetical protein
VTPLADRVDQRQILFVAQKIIKAPDAVEMAVDRLGAAVFSLQVIDVGVLDSTLNIPPIPDYSDLKFVVFR